MDGQDIILALTILVAIVATALAFVKPKGKHTH